MESLAETPWDVAISGTGLGQSLLALWVESRFECILCIVLLTVYQGPLQVR